MKPTISTMVNMSKSNTTIIWTYIYLSSIWLLNRHQNDQYVNHARFNSQHDIYLRKILEHGGRNVRPINKNKTLHSNMDLKSSYELQKL